jgi:HEAT repeat protein/ATP/ADP translocase
MKHFLQMLNLRRNELSRIGLAATIFLLVAVNDGLVKSVSSGVYNIRVGPDHLPEMYGWIAILFSATMVLLSWLTTRISRQRLVLALFVALLVLLVSNTLMLWSVEISAGRAPFVGFYSFLFVSSELVRNIAGFQIWAVAAGICYLSRARVLFPLLAASTTLGDIGGGFFVRLLGGWLDSWQFYGLAAMNTIIIIGLLRPLMRRYFVAPAREAEAESNASLTENLRYFAGSSYLRLLFILSLLLFAVYTAIHYGFNVVARMHYPDEGQITSFFGLFFGLAGTATLVTTTLLLRHVMRWLGVGNVYLWVCVIHVAIALLLAALFQGALSLPPVMVILSVNLVNYVLLDSVIAPTYQVLMKLVPERHTDGTRMVMEGGFMLLGGLLGAGLTMLHAQELLSLWQLFLVLLFIGLIMIAIGWRLRQRYREVLVQAVREQHVDVGDMASMRDILATSSDVPRGLLLHSSDGVRDIGIEILRNNPQVAAEVCLPLVAHENPRIRAAAWKALAGDGGVLELGALTALDDEDEQVRLSAAQAIARMVEEAGVHMITEAARRHVIAGIGPRLLSRDGNPELQAEFLFVLDSLEDGNTATIRSVIVEELLNSEDIGEICAGIDVIRRLDQPARYDAVSAHLAHTHPAVREAAVRAVGRSGSRQGCVALVAALVDSDPDVVEAAVLALEEAAPSHGAFLAAGLSSAPTKQWDGLIRSLARCEDATVAPVLLENCRQRLVAANRYITIGATLRNRTEGAATLLHDQLELDCRTVRDGAISLLGQLGDVDVVSDLIERMHDEAPGARDNAIELLENIGNRALLAPLLPLLSDDLDERLVGAVRVSGWENGVPDLAEGLDFVLQSPDSWTQLAGAWAARCLEQRPVLTQLRSDAPDFVKEITDLERIQTERGQQPLTNMEKITFLKESPFFATLPLEELYHIALSVQEESVQQGTIVIQQGTIGDKMYIVVEGQLEVSLVDDGGRGEGQRVAEYADKEVFGEMSLLDDEPRSASVISLSECRLLSLQRRDLERILRRNSSIAFSMMRILSRRLRKSMVA